jgi:enamine deaminase RidA (YjgF/YER057c/UK114 family)
VERRRISSAQPLEERYGYSRAVAVGTDVYVSGTIATMPDGSDPPADAYAQARRALEIIVAALGDAGAKPADVVRTRIYVTRAEDMQDVGRAHGEVFGDARPATTALVVSLLDPRWLVEIEAHAVVASRSGG